MLAPGKYLIHCNGNSRFTYPQWIPSLNDFRDHETTTVLREVTLTDLITYKTVGAALAGFFRLIDLGHSSFKVNFDVDSIYKALLNDTTYHLPLYDISEVTLTRPTGVHFSIRRDDQWVGYHHFVTQASIKEVETEILQNLDHYVELLQVAKSVLIDWCISVLKTDNAMQLNGYAIHTHVVS